MRKEGFKTSAIHPSAEAPGFLASRNKTNKGITSLTPDQIFALGKKCSMCNKNATWIFKKEEPAYCDRHFPFKEDYGSFFGDVHE